MIKFFRHIREQLLSEGKFSQYMIYAIGEIVLVVIGILLALQINNWKEEENITAEKTKTLQLIQKELLANKATITAVYEYHIMVRDTLEKIQIPESEAETKQAFSFWRGLQILKLPHSAFDTAVQSGIIKEFDVEMSEQLNGLYAFVEAYNDFGTTASTALYGFDFSDINNYEKIATFLHMVMVDLYYFEYELLQRFEDCMSLVEGSNMIEKPDKS